MENNNRSESWDFPPGALEPMILASLCRQRHGHALVQRIGERSDEHLQVREDFPALERLLKTRMVKAEWTDSPTGSRRIRIYQITRLGPGRLKGEISAFDRMPEGIQRILVPERLTANS